MDTSENPYLRLPTGFDPHKFYGSLHWVHFVLEEVSATPPRDLELIGLPGMGKTTLLQYLAHPDGAFAQHAEWLQPPFHKEPERIFPVLVDFRQAPTDTHPFVYLCRRFHEEYSLYRDRQPPPLRADLPALPAPREQATAESSADTLEGAIRELVG